MWVFVEMEYERCEHEVSSGQHMILNSHDVHVQNPVDPQTPWTF